jgi:hypothetical protein
LVTTTFTVPAELAGVIAVIEVSLTRTTLVAATPPIKTEVTVGVKPVPVMVTAVPPAVEPVAGEILVTVGVEIGTAVNVAVQAVFALGRIVVVAADVEAGV